MTETQNPKPKPKRAKKSEPPPTLHQQQKFPSTFRVNGQTVHALACGCGLVRLVTELAARRGVTCMNPQCGARLVMRDMDKEEVRR